MLGHCPHFCSQEGLAGGLINEHGAFLPLLLSFFYFYCFEVQHKLPGHCPNGIQAAHPSLGAQRAVLSPG